METINSDKTNLPIKSWVRFLQDLELARHYPHHNLVSSPFGRLVRNPILEALLPASFFLRLVSILDEALIFYIDDNQLNYPRKYRWDLFNRIRFLSEFDKLKAPSAIDELREKRNHIAHDAETEQIDWEYLDRSVDLIEEELQHLELVTERPKYEFFRQRSRARDLDDPKIAFGIDCVVGLKQEGDWVYRIEWTENIHRSGG